LLRVIVTTYQALSGAGYPGVSSLNILGNVVPFIQGEEEKIATETRKILGTVEGSRIAEHPMEVLPSCTRVPVENGHLISVAVEFEEQITEEAVTQAFVEYSGPEDIENLHSAPKRPVILNKQPDRPQPRFDLKEGNGMAITIGRLRVDGHFVRFFLLSHNTIRGAAGGSIYNAELVHKRGLLEVE
jgi:aspartate-semialdehyde dehydrogenase